MRRERLPLWARPAAIADLLRLSVPIAISRMSMMLMGITDAIVLGQYAPGELPFILNSWLPIGVTLGFGMGLFMGVQVLTSELSGVGQSDQSGRIFRRGFWGSVALGIVLTGVIYVGAGPLFRWIFVDIAPPSDVLDKVDPAVVAASTAEATRIISLSILAFMVSVVCSLYLEALRKPGMVMVVMYVGVLVNLALDIWLVANRDMGAEGVAWATTGSRWALTLVMLGLVIWLTPAFKPSPDGPANETRRQFSVGIGTAISNVAEWGGFNMTYIIATWISLAANSVYGYSVQIMGLCFMFYLGIGSATSVRVAEGFGRRNRDEVRNAGRLGIVATGIMGLILMAIVISFRDPISRLLVNDEAVLNGIVLAPAIASLLLLAAFATIFDGLQATASMALRAQEVVWVPGLIHIGSFFLVMLPSCYWLGIVEERGARGMMEGALIGVLIAGVAQTVLLEWKATRPVKHRAA